MILHLVMVRYMVVHNSITKRLMSRWLIGLNGTEQHVFYLQTRMDVPIQSNRAMHADISNSSLYIGPSFIIEACKLAAVINI